MGFNAVVANLKTFRVSKTLKVLDTRFILPGLLLIGLILRAWQLKGAFWYDEAFSAWLAQLSPENLLTATFYDVHPPAYYLLLWLLNRFFGHSEPVLRFPSLVASVFLIYLVYRLANSLRLPGPATWLATAITALAPFQVYYGCEARFYAIQMVCIALAVLGLVEHRRWLLIIGSVAALYLHNVSIVYVGSLFLTGFVFVRRDLKWLFLTGVIIMACSIPGAIYAYAQARAISGNYWIPAITSPGRILALLDDIIFMSPGNPFVIASAFSTAMGLLFILIIIPRVPGNQQQQYNFLLASWLLPIALLVIASVLWQPVIISRILAPVSPFYYLSLAWSVTRLRRNFIVWLTATLPAMIAILTGVIVGALGHPPVNYSYLSLYNNYRAGDAIYHANPGSYLTFEYYRPDIPQFVLSQGAKGLILDPRTRAAMGMDEIRFELIKCANIDGQQVKRWWLIESNGPHTTQAEMDYIDYIVTTYPVINKIPIHQESMIEARLYLIDPRCTDGQKEIKVSF